MPSPDIDSSLEKSASPKVLLMLVVTNPMVAVAFLMVKVLVTVPAYPCTVERAVMSTVGATSSVASAASVLLLKLRVL